MTDDSDLSKAVEEYVFTVEDLINELKKIRKEFKKWQIGCMSGKTIGLTIGSAGTTVGIIGVSGAPFTLGITGVLVGLGIGVGILGAATSTVSGFIKDVSKK